MPGEDLSDLGTEVAPSGALPSSVPSSAPPAETADADIEARVDAIISHESGGDPLAVGDKGLALGLGQMHPEVRRAYNVRPDSTPEEQRAAVKSYFTDLLKKRGGNVEDAVSEYHLGATNYDRDRQSEDNLKYLATHQQHLGRSAASTGAVEDLSDLGSAVPPTPPPTAPEQSAAASAIESHEADLSTRGRETNIALGKDPEHWLGQYTARIERNTTNALKDFFEGASNITHPKGFSDALGSLMQILHPLALPGEAATDLVWRAMNDTGFAASHPSLAAAFSTAVGVGVGAATPVPGVPKVKMPLQGSRTLRAGAEEAAGVAERAGVWAGAQREAGEAATAAAQAEAERVAAEAPKAAEAVSAGATERAKAALTPTGAAEAGGGAARTALEEKLATMREQTGAIYDTYVQAHADEVVTPEVANRLAKAINETERRVGGFRGAPGDVFETIRDRLREFLPGAEAPPYTVGELNNIKTRLDSLMPAVAKTGVGKDLNLLRLEVRKALRSGATGEEADWLNVADTLWRDEIAGKGMTATSLGSIVKLAKKSDPTAVVEKLFGTGNSDAQGAMAKAVMRHLEGTPQADGLREAVFARMFKPDAEGNLDPKALLEAYDGLNESFRRAFTNPGAEAFFRTERQLQDEASRAAAAVKPAARQAKQVAAEAERQTAAAEKVAAGAQAEAQAATDSAKAPNKLAKLGAYGLKIAGVGVAEAVGRHFGIPGVGAPAAMMEMMIPAADIAKFLANSKTANLLARMLKTPANSAVVPTLLQQLRDSELGRQLLTSPEGQQKETEAAQVMLAEEAHAAQP